MGGCGAAGGTVASLFSVPASRSREAACYERSPDGPIAEAWLSLQRLNRSGPLKI